jgi:hypothetical protein
MRLSTSGKALLAKLGSLAPFLCLPLSPPSVLYCTFALMYFNPLPDTLEPLAKILPSVHPRYAATHLNMPIGLVIRPTYH